MPTDLRNRAPASRHRQQGASKAPRGRALRFYARQSQAADLFLKRIVDNIRDDKNPVIRLEASHALLASDELFKAQRREAMLALRSEGWTWEEIGSVIGVGKERAWQVGNGL
jgi:hypothetical protein